MLIKILSDSSQMKGKDFEMFVVNILDQLGYADFAIDIKATGRELDIYATHKSTNERLLCECKAHLDPIGPQDITDFYGKFSLDHDKNNVDKGIFISISGFTSNANYLYLESHAKTKQNLELWDNNKLIILLREIGTLTTDEVLDSLIQKNTAYTKKSRYIVVFNQNFT